jgi:hypothetical protein
MYNIRMYNICIIYINQWFNGIVEQTWWTQCHKPTIWGWFDSPLISGILWNTLERMSWPIKAGWELGGCKQNTCRSNVEPMKLGMIFLEKMYVDWRMMIDRMSRVESQFPIFSNWIVTFSSQTQLLSDHLLCGFDPTGPYSEKPH